MATDPLVFIARARGRTPAEIIVEGIGGWWLAANVIAISGLQTIAEFMLLPFRLLMDVAGASVNAFILEPLGLTSIGAQITGGELDIFGFFALPVAVALALGVLLMVLLYLQLPITSNILPGFLLDSRIVAYLFTTPEEEAAGED